MKQTGTADLLRLQARVIAALILRETRATFGTSPVGYLWAIFTPAVSVAFLVFLFSLAERQPPFGSSLALFFATGALTLQFFNELSNKLMTVFDANHALLTYPIIKDLDALLARAMLVAATYVLIMALFYGALLAMGLASLPARPEHVILAFLSTWLLGLGFGAVNAVVTSLWESWIHIEKVLTRPLFFISGIFYVPSQLPQQARDILQWNPVLHLVEWFRHGFYPNYNSMVFDPWYPVAIGAALLLLALTGERLFRKERY
jgi:capsular polysaccharide transport system permease protein